MSTIVSKIEYLENQVSTCKERLDNIDQSLRHGNITDTERENLLNEEVIIKEDIGKHETELKSLRSENRKSMLVSVAILGVFYVLYILFLGT